MNTKKAYYLVSIIALVACVICLPIKTMAASSDSSDLPVIAQSSAQNMGINYPIKILILADKTSIYTDGLDTANLRVVIIDSIGNGVGNIVIKFGNLSGKDIISPTDGVTDINGVANFKISSKQEHISTFQFGINNPTTGELYSSNALDLTFVNKSTVGNVTKNAVADFRTDPITQQAAAYVLTPVVAAGAVAGVSSSIINFVNSFFPYLNYLINLLLQFFGIKRKQKTWGLVYDSMFKKPIGLAIVRVFNAKSKSLVQTSVTDEMGRFSFDLSNDRYILEVKKPFYIFPSKLIKGASIDGVYHDLYFGDAFNFRRGERLNFSVPIDQETAIEARINVWDRIRSLSKKISLPILVISLLLSIFILWIDTTLLSEILVVLYTLMIIERKRFKGETFQPWGTVFDAKGRQVIFGIPIKIFDRKYNKLLETRISNENGEFNFVLPRGEYYLRIASSKYAISKNAKKFNENPNYFGENFKVEDNEVLRFNIPLKKQ